jgi:hypothetical protein
MRRWSLAMAAAMGLALPDMSLAADPRLYVVRAFRTVGLAI